jgi:hypothetical protein
MVRRKLSWSSLEDSAESEASQSDDLQDIGLIDRSDVKTIWECRHDLLKAMKVPEILICMLLAGGILKCDLSSVEIFSGVQSITRGFRTLGYTSEAFDKILDPAMDVNTLFGFSMVCKLVLRLRPSGFLWAAPPCSSWVFLSKNSTGRRKCTPLGFQENFRVSWNNTLVHRLCCLLELATSFQIFWILEQPTSSTLWQHPRCIKLLERHGSSIHRAHTYMGMYGGESPKGMKLVGTAPWLSLSAP